MLDKEYNFFKTHKEEFFSKYQGKYIVIANDSVSGVYNTLEEAMKEAQKTMKIGEFLVQKCTNDDDLTMRFHSRVRFA